MFVSANQLVRSYGIDNTIARFFVDREPPAENLYWHNKLLYIRPAPGYLFIPLIVDLLYKLGIERQQLLSDRFVRTMEQIGHISALEETKNISAEEAITKCIQLVKENCTNREWLDNVINYFEGNRENLLSKLTTPFKALHRGDVFLFSLSTLEFQQPLFVQVAEQWFALIGSLLLLDDVEDVESDKETGEENAFLEAGLNAEGIQRIAALVEKNVLAINTVNPTMGSELERQYRERIQELDILARLNDTV
jgi:hypothetical protein